MDDKTSIEDRISMRYDTLSAGLRAAADYIIANPIDIATRSLRSVAASSMLSPPTFSRLARALDFASYEDMRELCRAAVGRDPVSFSDKAAALQEQSADETVPFVYRKSAAAVANIEALANSIDPERLADTVERMHRSRRTIAVGALSSMGIADYLGYMATWFSDRWVVTGQNGQSLGSALIDAGPEDCVLIITLSPFATRSIAAAELAAEKGAHVIVITDKYSCPALKHTDSGFIVSADSPQFFPSYISVLLLIETMVGMLVAKAGQRARDRIDALEKNNRRLADYWAV